MKAVKSLDEINADVYLLDFYADWCMPCKMLSPILEQVEAEVKIPIYKVNVDESRELAEVFGVMGIPTLVLMRGKNEVARHVGFANKEFLVGWIKKNLD